MANITASPKETLMSKVVLAIIFCVTCSIWLANTIKSGSAAQMKKPTTMPPSSTVHNLLVLARKVPVKSPSG